MAGDSIDTMSVAEMPGRSETTETAESGEERGKSRDRQKVGLVLAAVALFLILGFLLFRSTGQDDGYISYWPAHTLAHYGRIVNYNGEAVEQSSSMLWVLMLGTLAFLTRAPVPLLGPLLSIAGGILAIIMAFRLATRLDRRVPPYAVFLTATATYLVNWSFSGMETSFVGVCTAWLAIAYSDYLSGLRTRKLEIVAATICCLLVRPEMGSVLCVLLIGLGAALWIRRQRGLIATDAFKNLIRRTGFFALLVIGGILSLAAFRMAYFHSLVPEPVLVKGVGEFHLLHGLKYLIEWSSGLIVLPDSGQGILVLWSISLGALPAACLLLLGIALTSREAMGERSMNMARLVSWLLLVAYGCFIVGVGGDWMLAGRFLVHVLPIALVLAADALVRFTPPRFVPAVGATIVVMQLGAMVWSAANIGVGTSPLSPPAGVDSQTVSGLSWFERTNRLFLRDASPAQAVDRVVTRMIATGHPVVHLLSGQMGFVMYNLGTHHYGQIDVTDRHGLADRRLIGCSISQEQTQKNSGLDIGFYWFLEHQKELERDCRIPAPDIIYDIGSSNPKTIARIAHQDAVVLKMYGYALVYHQFCNVPPNRDWLPGDTHLQLAEYIAVRQELLPVLGLHEVPTDQFQDNTR